MHDSPSAAARTASFGIISLMDVLCEDSHPWFPQPFAATIISTFPLCFKILPDQILGPFDKDPEGCGNVECLRLSRNGCLLTEIKGVAWWRAETGQKMSQHRKGLST